jgi:CRP-like cAMP-binding protein
VIAEIDRRLEQVERGLEGHRALLAERDRLNKARAALTGEANADQISQDDVAAYLAEHGGSRPGDIAAHFGVSSGRVSAHLFRGKSSRFVSRGGEWYVREGKGGREA